MRMTANIYVGKIDETLHSLIFVTWIRNAKLANRIATMAFIYIFFLPCRSCHSDALETSAEKRKKKVFIFDFRTFCRHFSVLRDSSWIETLFFLYISVWLFRRLCYQNILAEARDYKSTTFFFSTLCQLPSHEMRTIFLFGTALSSCDKWPH